VVGAQDALPAGEEILVESAGLLVVARSGQVAGEVGG
jgi:hypothetical protein